MLLALVVVVFSLGPGRVASLQAGPRPSPYHGLHGPRGSLTTSSYRPRIRFTTGKATGDSLPITARFSTPRGHIDRIEVRLDGKIIDTIRPGKVLRVGKLETRVNLSAAGAGRHKLVLWVWQGRTGYRSLHGESKSYKFTR